MFIAIISFDGISQCIGEEEGNVLSRKKENAILKRRDNAMNNKMKNRLIVAFTMLFVFMGLTVGSPTSAAKSATPVEVIEVQTFGASYGEWSARWWQWALSIPAETNPILDMDGANCANGQYDDVWFLAGTFGGPAVRSCTIPAGKPIFFPLLNTAMMLKPYGYETLLDFRRSLAENMDAVTELSCSIKICKNGEEEECETVLSYSKDELVNFRVRSPSFTVIGPPKGVLPPGFLKVPAHADQIVSDGYWLLLSPLAQLPPGEYYEIKFGGERPGFSADVTYHLTIE
jgi:hypothetical protein